MTGVQLKTRTMKREDILIELGKINPTLGQFGAEVKDADLQNLLDKLNEDKARIGTLDNQVAELTIATEQLDEEKKNLEGQVSNLDDKVTEHELTIEQLNEDKASLQEQVDNASESELQNQIKELSKEVARLEKAEGALKLANIVEFEEKHYQIKGSVRHKNSIYTPDAIANNKEGILEYLLEIDSPMVVEAIKN